MKPFDLEKAKAGAPVCTRDGRAVRIVCFDRKGSNYPIVALRTMDDGCECVTTYQKDGRCGGSCVDCDADLMMVAEKKKGWMALFQVEDFFGGVLAVTSNVYTSKEEVEEAVQKMEESNRRAGYVLMEIRQIEWEE